jgi:type I restriction enzyme S subunit
VMTHSEQVLLRVFLDKETAKIDALIAKKRRLIELLQEKRTALITRAVTKGLDPNAPMNDSHVESLGHVPGHWQILRVKHLLKSRKAAIKTGPFGSQLQSFEMSIGDIKVYNQRNVLDRDFTAGDYYISYQKFHELRAFEVFPDDLLVTTRGTIGKCSVLPPQSERGIMHPCLMRLQLDQLMVQNRYFEILMQDSRIILDQLQQMSNATTIDVIYSDSLKSVCIPVPPGAEQHSIMNSLNKKILHLDTLTSKMAAGIDLLKEYRVALIAAAVTGKIDMGVEVAPNILGE